MGMPFADSFTSGNRPTSRIKKRPSSMYICQSCKTQVGAGLPALSKVISYRQKTYPERWQPGAEGRKPKLIELGGEGWEIEREIKICADCL